MTIQEREEIIHNKIFRFSNKNKLRVLDLFSGCGGLSLGFHKAGFDLIAGVDIDKYAALSNAINFHNNSTFFEQHCKPKNILETSPQLLLRSIGIKENISTSIDIIIGGPPCQAFTRVGRAKLRSVKNDSKAFLNDKRSQLYKRYLEYVKELAPVSILMENVPDMLNYGGTNIADLVCDDLSKLGYKCKYTLLNAVHYEVPQMRERVFIIAIHKSLKVDVTFPSPTHYYDLPKGYHGSRSVALKHVNLNDNSNYYFQQPRPIENLKPAVTTFQAISDLPEIKDHLTNNLKKGVKKLDHFIKYEKDPENAFQMKMRNWHFFETNDEVNANVIRLLPRDYPIFRKMKPGDQYPQAVLVAQKLFESKLKRLIKKTGYVIPKNTSEYKNLLKEVVPPYDATKFPNKWRKMEANHPSRTLMAHLGKDCYSHIHYDSNQARTISVREAARLQSFPDGFLFSGAMNAAFRQIGNAVPPLLAEKIALSLKELLKTNYYI